MQGCMRDLGRGIPIVCLIRGMPTSSGMHSLPNNKTTAKA
jgi:hypothetical protein